MSPPLLHHALAPLLQMLDLAAIGVFALSGAIVAGQKRQSMVTFVFFAIVTGVGGGTFRDLLIGAPVFWIERNSILFICIAAAVICWILPEKWWRGKALLWLDAAGLAAYAAFGAAKGLAYGIAPLPAIAMGVLTGCLGGIIRDVLAGEPSILMRSELYVTAAAFSAALTVGLLVLGVPGPVAGVVATLAGFGLRAGAITRGWSMPGYRGQSNPS
jgi:uncharacterized membrane protein YeiH